MSDSKMDKIGNWIKKKYKERQSKAAKAEAAKKAMEKDKEAVKKGKPSIGSQINFPGAK